MQIGTFRKNVAKTVGTKSAKAGLRLVAKNTQRTNIFHTAVALQTEVGHLFTALTPYLRGEQFSKTTEQAALPVFGDVGASLVSLARILKVKTPTSTKKSKLVGTRMPALLALATSVNEVARIASEGVFKGPITKTEKKVITLPATGAKEEREVSVVDTEKESAAELARVEDLKPHVIHALDVYWRLSTDMFKTPPAPIFAEKMDRLKQEYPAIEFETSETSEPVSA